MQFVLLGFAVPLIALFYGTDLIGAEVQRRTMVYLLTRKMRRGTVLLAKFAATGLALTLIVALACGLVYLCALGGLEINTSPTRQRTWVWQPLSDLGAYLLLAPLAALAYLAVYTLAGLIASRPLGFAIGYFILEISVSNIPVAARQYTVLHHLRKTMVEWIPGVGRLYPIPADLFAQLYPKGSTGVAALAALVFVALALSFFLVTRRELVPAKVAKE
jgi:ABC-type transport system involved in multi-copper enzyme maturation permease subunit